MQHVTASVISDRRRYNNIAGPRDAVSKRSVYCGSELVHYARNTGSCRGHYGYEKKKPDRLRRRWTWFSIRPRYQPSSVVIQYGDGNVMSYVCVAMRARHERRVAHNAYTRARARCRYYYFLFILIYLFIYFFCFYPAQR